MNSTLNFESKNIGCSKFVWLGRCKFRTLFWASLMFSWWQARQRHRCVAMAICELRSHRNDNNIFLFPKQLRLQTKQNPREKIHLTVAAFSPGRAQQTTRCKTIAKNSGICWRNPIFSLHKEKRLPPARCLLQECRCLWLEICANCEIWVWALCARACFTGREEKFQRESGRSHFALSLGAFFFSLTTRREESELASTLSQKAERGKNAENLSHRLWKWLTFYSRGWPRSRIC